MSTDESTEESTDETGTGNGETGPGAERATRATEQAPLPSEKDVDEKATLDGHAIEAELLADWRVMFDVLHARFSTGDFSTGVELVSAIGALADEADHHPDVDLSYGFVDVRLSSHDVGGVTSRDVDLARQVSDAAGRLGAEPAPHTTSVLELALDTHDHEEIKPFWAALLGYQSHAGDDDALYDPDGRGPTLWFQKTERGETPGQRFHLDLRVPPENAEQRVRAALEAGGTLVSDERQPSFTVVADAQGNRACVTTWLGRS